MRVAEVTIRVNFDGGETAEFTASPNGQLNPVCGWTTFLNKTTTSVWYEAAKHLIRFGFKLPDPSCPARVVGGGFCWPWSTPDSVEENTPVEGFQKDPFDPFAK